MRRMILTGLMGLLFLSTPLAIAADGELGACGKIAHCGSGPNVKATYYGWTITGMLCDEPDGTGPVIVAGCTTAQLRQLCPNAERIETEFDRGFSMGCRVGLKSTK